MLIDFGNRRLVKLYRDSTSQNPTDAWRGQLIDDYGTTEERRRTSERMSELDALKWLKHKIRELWGENF